eukprot:5087242-Alexandrium_andersonii.AAC.1
MPRRESRFGELVRYLARPGSRERSRSAPWGQGIWLGRRRGAAAQVAAVRADEVRAMRAVSRVPEADK